MVPALYLEAYTASLEAVFSYCMCVIKFKCLYCHKFFTFTTCYNHESGHYLVFLDENQLYFIGKD
jgi:hypothetical protein